MFSDNFFGSAIIEQTQWYPSIEQVIVQYGMQFTPDILDLLNYPGSLTLSFQSKAGDSSLVIKLLDQHTRLVQEDNQETKVTERIIQMIVNEQPWLYARSCFNAFAVDYFGADLTNLGNQSLGLLLIRSYPDIIRGNFEYGVINNNIARRSVYSLNQSNQSNNKIALFSLEEVFLPALFTV